MQDESLWQAVLGEIELSISRASFVTWFKQTHLVRHTEESIIIGVPNIFAKQQLEVKYQPLIVEILAKNGFTKPVEFKIHAAGALHRKTEDSEPVILQGRRSGTNDGSPAVQQTYRQGLNERYTFENFIVGSGNELAYAACQAVAQHAGTKYNPLFIYGGVGIGKTHLIQAVGNGILQREPKSKVVYITCEQFVQEFLGAIRYKKIGGFANHYRGADVLIVDDMQFIAGKEKTQEEFFHTFNTLHQANKQIILSSDRPPKSIPTLEDRLRTRFEWGMTVDMQAPDFETRCAILQTKATSHNVTLPADVVEFLSNYAQNNVRELEGALNQLLAFCEMRNLSPDLMIVTGLFGGQRARPKHLSAKHIIERTARYFQIPLDDMLGPKRDKDIVLPRQVAMYLLRSELHLSFPKVARELGRKDHTTAIHSVEKINGDINLNPILKQQVNDIKERLYA